MALEQEVENWQDLQEKQGTTVAGGISSFPKASSTDEREKKKKSKNRLFIPLVSITYS